MALPTAEVTSRACPTQASSTSLHIHDNPLIPAKPFRIKEELYVRKRLTQQSTIPSLLSADRQTKTKPKPPPIAPSPFKFKTKVKKPSLLRELKRVFPEGNVVVESRDSLVQAGTGNLIKIEDSCDGKSNVKRLRKREVLERAWGRSEESIIAERRRIKEFKEDMEVGRSMGKWTNTERKVGELHELEDYYGEGSIGMDELEREEDGLDWNSGIGIKIRGNVPDAASKQQRRQKEEEWEDVPEDESSKPTTEDVAKRISEGDILRASRGFGSPRDRLEEYRQVSRNKRQDNMDAEVQELLRSFREGKSSEGGKEKDRRKRDLNLFLSHHNTIPPPPDPLTKSKPEKEAKAVRNEAQRPESKKSSSKKEAKAARNEAQRPESRKPTNMTEPNPERAASPAPRTAMKSKTPSSIIHSLNISNLPYIRHRLSSHPPVKQPTSSTSKIISLGGIITISPAAYPLTTSISPSNPTIRDYESMGYIRLDLKQKKFVYTIIPLVTSSNDKESKLLLHTRPGVILKKYDTLKDVPVKHWPAIKFAAKFVGIVRKSVVIVRVEGQLPVLPTSNTIHNNNKILLPRERDGYVYEFYRGEVFADGKFMAELVPRGRMDFTGNGKNKKRSKSGSSGTTTTITTTTIGTNSTESVHDCCERGVLIGTLRVEMRKLGSGRVQIRIWRKEEVRGGMLGIRKRDGNSNDTKDGLTILWEGEMSVQGTDVVGELGSWVSVIRWAWGVWGECNRLKK